MNLPLAVATSTTALPLGLDDLTSPEGISRAVKIALIMTALAVLPSLVVMFTSFVRLIIVMFFLRQALGTQSFPPNHVLIGLSLMLTCFIMAPLAEQIHETAVIPYQTEQLSGEEALTLGADQLKGWMLRNTRDNDVLLFASLAEIPRPTGPHDLPLRVVMPAFLISELKTGFQIGFLLFIPFVVIDLVVSSVLLSMGMMMLPPVMISFPFKILLFVLVDGWHVLVQSLVESFH
ncbi:MAG: flagellar type III secretion system pore protein FliP [bacterium]|nr:flagellar type III secretion system pore protein FliP [bacterium]